MVVNVEFTTNALTVDYAGGTPVMTFQTGGSVGVGTTTPCGSTAPSGCRLSVNGGIQAKEVVVNANWSDYVFAPGYRLKPLNEVAAYINEDRHLPEIPSAAEVQEKGVSLGEMQSKLLAKVEELTLYMIEANKRIDDLERRNQLLEEKIGEAKIQ